MRGVFLRLDAFDQTNDLVSAVVLSQIQYWSGRNKKGKSRLKVRREGYLWLAKTHKQWWDECRLTRRQVDRAIHRLERLGLIATSVFKFGRSPTRHVRLHLQVQTDCTYKCKPYTENTKQEKTDTTNVVSISAWTKNVHAKTQPGETQMGVGSEEVKAKLEAKKVPTEQKEIKNSNDLATEWERLIPYYHKEKLAGILKPLTWKEKGQLSKFLKHVGKEEAYKVMKWAVSNWLDFSLEVKSMKAVAMPSLPQVGVLLQHWDIALRESRKLVQLTAKPNKGVKLLSKEEKKQAFGG